MAGYRVYLAGPITGCNPTQQTRWRKEIKRELGSDFSWEDPTAWKGDWDPMREILAIDTSDVVVANMWRESIGTTIDICHARNNGKPVVLIDSNDLEHKILVGLVEPLKPVRSVREAANRVREVVKGLRPISVQKKNGEIRDFSQRKLLGSVKAACAEAGVNEALFLHAVLKLARERIQTQASQGPVKTLAIKQAVFDALGQIEASATYDAPVRQGAGKVRQQWAKSEEVKGFVRDAQLEIEILREDLGKIAADRDHFERSFKAILANRRPADPAKPIDGKPPTSVLEAVQRAQHEYADCLVFHKRALETAKDSPYRYPDRAYRALAILGECARERRRVAAGGKPPPGTRQWFRRHVTDLPGLDHAPHESQTTLGKWGNERTLVHDGKRVTMEQHLGLGDERDPAACLRIYFAPDSDTTFVVGHVGRHLTNTST